MRFKLALGALIQFCLQYEWTLKWLDFEWLMRCHVYFCAQINCLILCKFEVWDLGDLPFPPRNFYPEQIENSDGWRGDNTASAEKYKNTKIQKIQKGKNTSLQFLGAAHNSKNHPALPKSNFWQNAEKGFNAQTITAAAEHFHKWLWWSNQTEWLLYFQTEIGIRRTLTRH